MCRQQFPYSGPVVHYIFLLFSFLFSFLFSPLVSLLFSLLFYSPVSLLYYLSPFFCLLSSLPSLVPKSLPAVLTRGEQGCGLYNGFMHMRAIVSPRIPLHSAADSAMERSRINEASFQLESAYNHSKVSFLHEAKAILTTLDGTGSSNAGDE